ncbi:hypothetical protein HJFPF1_06533 [Paramyrothecium foliicola]|nr:hypothetical protein HJFPF1_06533 [Paramyrothecium foliicola]
MDEPRIGNLYKWMGLGTSKLEWLAAFIAHTEWGLPPEARCLLAPWLMRGDLKQRNGAQVE